MSKSQLRNVYSQNNCNFDFNDKQVMLDHKELHFKRTNPLYNVNWPAIENPYTFLMIAVIYSYREFFILEIMEI